MSEWTDEQAVDAVVSVLSEDFTVATLYSWFKPDPKQTKPGMSEWVSRADHARGMLQVGRALLTLERERNEALRDANVMQQMKWDAIAERDAELAASGLAISRAIAADAEVEWLKAANAAFKAQEAEVVALRAEVARMRAALDEMPAIARGLGEHGVKIVCESEAAKDAAWPHDPAFVTKFSEVMRVYADGIAVMLEKRIAAVDAYRASAQGGAE